MASIIQNICIIHNDANHAYQQITSQVKVLESRYMTSAPEAKSNTTVTIWIFQWAFKAGCRILFVLFSFRHSSKGQFQIIIIL